MKVVNWSDLMKEPEGTIYQQYSFRGGIHEPKVFGGPCGERDFVCASLLPQAIHLDCHGKDTPRLAQQFKMDERAVVLSYPTGFGRDGSFETDRFFLIWEKADREKFAAWLLDPVKCAAEQNDDPHAMISAEKASTGEEL